MKGKTALEKSILNCNVTDPNKILPIRYGWARQHYKTGVANNWVPEEVSMQKDVEMWKNPHALTEDERRVILWNMGFFSTAESLTANNIVLIIYKHITNAECRQYLLRQAYEEAVHTDTFIYCCDSLGLDPEKVYNMYADIASIKKKDTYVVEMTSSLLDAHFTTQSAEGVQRFVHDLIGYYLIMEGLFFYAGFVMMLSLLRQSKMVGVGEQFQFILRDESVHLAFGVDLVNTIVQENPTVWTAQFKKTLTENVMRAVELEYEYAQDCLPRGILGLNADTIKTYLEYIADRRLKSIHLEAVYGSSNPFPWMSEIIDLRKEKNFFEMRVTEYQTGRLTWE